jgi:hypothetical protein
LDDDDDASRRDATRRTDERRDDGIADDGTTGSPTSVRSVRSRFRTEERTNDDASELEEYFVSSSRSRNRARVVVVGGGVGCDRTKRSREPVAVVAQSAVTR